MINFIVFYLVYSLFSQEIYMYREREVVKKESDYSHIDQTSLKE